MVVGVCMVVGGMHGCGGHAWLWGVCMVVGMCMAAGGMCGCRRGCAWLQGGMHGIQRDTVNERAVRILLECILVSLDTYLSDL